MRFALGVTVALRLKMNFYTLFGNEDQPDFLDLCRGIGLEL